MARYGELKKWNDGTLTIEDCTDEGRMFLTDEDAIELRDLLLQHFPLPMSEAEFLKPATDLMDATYQAARRERIATAVLTGLCADPHRDQETDNFTETPRIALLLTDTLIAALDEEKP